MFIIHPPYNFYLERDEDGHPTGAVQIVGGTEDAEVWLSVAPPWLIEVIEREEDT